MRLIGLVPALAPALTLVLALGSATAEVPVDERRSSFGISALQVPRQERAAFVGSQGVFRLPVQRHGPLACPGGFSPASAFGCVAG